MQESVMYAPLPLQRHICTAFCFLVLILGVFAFCMHKFVVICNLMGILRSILVQVNLTISNLLFCVTRSFVACKTQMFLKGVHGSVMLVLILFSRASDLKRNSSQGGTRDPPPTPACWIISTGGGEGGRSNFFFNQLISVCCEKSKATTLTACVQVEAPQSAMLLKLG